MEILFIFQFLLNLKWNGVAKLIDDIMLYKHEFLHLYNINLYEITISKINLVFKKLFKGFEKINSLFEKIIIILFGRKLWPDPRFTIFYV